MSADFSIELAGQLRDLLQAHRQRLVLAESCTAGRVAATLANLPGISQWLCGSFVVYRSQSKTEWLGIPTAVLDDPGIGPVSATTSLLLAQAALERTSEADVAVAVTGDIGPGVAADKDGKIFCARVTRDGNSCEAAFHLTAPTPTSTDDVAARSLRIEEATRLVLQFAIQTAQTASSQH
jgi:PncC family amidohydrolase